MPARDFLKGTLAWNMERLAAQFVPDVMITQNMVGTGGTFTITSPGTYALAEDLTVTGTAIQINSSDVVLDLNEHTIFGGAGVLGISVQNAVQDIAIQNGYLN